MRMYDRRPAEMGKRSVKKQIYPYVLEAIIVLLLIVLILVVLKV